MSLQSVRDYLACHAPDITIIELDTSTATVALAAETHGVVPGRIAKTLAFRLADDRNVSLTRLAVSKDVLKALVKLKDTGDRFFNLSGDGSDTIGSFDLTGVAGTFMRVPVVLLPNADAGLASFIDPAAVVANFSIDIVIVFINGDCDESIFDMAGNQSVFGIVDNVDKDLH